MALTYTTAVKNARLEAVVAEIGTGGKLEIGTAGMAAVLATFTLENTAGTAAAGVLTLAGMPKTVAAGETGTAAAARIRKSDNTDVVTDLTVTATGGGGDITVDNTSINSGQNVTLSSATITHA